MNKNFLTINEFSSEQILELYITFNISNKVYAIEAKRILEIVQLPALQILEKMPEYTVGIMNFRGKFVNIIDLRKFLGILPVAYSVDHQVLIIDTNDSKNIGIVIDSVNNVVQYNKENLEPLPYQSDKKFIQGIHKEADNVVAFLDIDIMLENIQIDSSESQDNTEPYQNLNMFPLDYISQDKFNKRAIKLQKELKADISLFDNQKNRFISFSLNNEIYCINLSYVKEFCKINPKNLTPIPCVPEFIAGIFNLRGEFITIIDLKSFLEISKSVITDKTKIIIVKLPAFQVGIIVDEVFDIINISSTELNYNSHTKFDENNFIFTQVLMEQKKLISILNIERLLHDEKLFVDDII